MLKCAAGACRHAKRVTRWSSPAYSRACELANPVGTRPCAHTALMSTKPGDQSTFDDSRDLTALPAYEPYPAWSVSHTLPDLVAQYGHLEPGTKATDAVVFAAGRITAKRDASKNLVFLDITADGCTVQVMASKGMYEGTAACQDGSDVQFRAMLGALRRGDVVGIRGIPGQSGKGELSLLPYEVVLLAPCQHNLPLPGQLRDPVRADRFPGRCPARAHSHALTPCSLTSPLSPTGLAIQAQICRHVDQHSDMAWWRGRRCQAGA